MPPSTMRHRPVGPTSPCPAAASRSTSRNPQTAADPVVRCTSGTVDSGIGSPSMDMLTGGQIAEANLTDWRKLAQGLHARYVIDAFGTGARLVAAVGEAGGALGHPPRGAHGTGDAEFQTGSDRTHSP